MVKWSECQNHVFKEFRYSSSKFFCFFFSIFQHILLALNKVQSVSLKLRPNRASQLNSFRNDINSKIADPKMNYEIDDHSQICLLFWLSVLPTVFMYWTWHLLVQKSELKYYQNLFTDLKYLFTFPCTVTTFRGIWEKS